MTNTSHKHIAQAIQILISLGFPRTQQNERSALCLLALLNLTPRKKWAQAENPLIGITPIMDWVREHYQKEYAPNTRETVRRQTMHQFVDAGIALYNPDSTDRPVNSPKAVYQIEPMTLDLLRSVGSKSWHNKLIDYRAQHETLAAKYAKEREHKRIPVQIEGGKKITLSPGEHSELIRAIIEEFGPRFAPGSVLIYAGDTGDKWGYFDAALLSELGVDVDSHGKMPDVVLHYIERNWLLLVESVTSHGPVDGKRHVELAQLFAGAKAGLVYVTAFPNRAIMAEILNLGFDYWLIMDMETRDAEESRKILEAKLNRTSALNNYLKNRESMKFKEEDMREQLEGMNQERHKVPQFNMHIVIDDGNPEMLDKKTKKVIDAFSRMDSIKATKLGLYKTLKTFFDIIPGNPRTPTLKHAHSSTNVSSLLPLRKEAIGPSEPHIITETPSQVILLQHFFHPDYPNWNTFTIGPSGYGKSVRTGQENLACAYAGIRVLQIDSGYSQKYVTKLCGGKFLIFGKDNISKNFLDFTDEEIRMALSMSNSDNDTIGQAITTISSLLLDADQHHLSNIEEAILERSIMSLLSKVKPGAPRPLLRNLKEEILRVYPEDEIARNMATKFDGFTFDTQKGKLFDQQTSMQIDPNFTVIDLKPIETKDQLFRSTVMAIMSEYLRIVSKRDGTFKRIKVDEGWQIAKEQFGRKFLAIFYRTLRKYDGAIDFITQSLADVNEGEMKKAVTPNAYTQCIVGIPTNQDDLVASFFELSEREMAIAKSLKPVPGSHTFRYNITQTEKNIQVDHLAGLPYWATTSTGIEITLIEGIADDGIEGLDSIYLKRYPESEQQAYMELFKYLGQTYPPRTP